MLNVILFVSTYFAGIFSAFRLAPAYAFLTYQAVYFFNPLERWWGGMLPDISFSYYLVILMLCLYLFNKKKFDSAKLSTAPQLKLFLILVILYSFAYFYAINQKQHFSYLEPYVKLYVIVFLAYKLINSIKLLDLALVAYVYGATYLSFVAFQTGRNSGNRVEGIGMVDSPDSNGTAAALAPALVLCVYYVWINRSILNKFAFVICAAFIANALVLINSRGAFLASFLGLFYFMATLFFSSVKSNLQKTKVVAVGVLGLMSLLSVMDSSFISRMGTIFSETQVSKEKESGATRTVFWKAAIDMSLDYPFGQGAKGFNHYGPVYIPYDIKVTSRGGVDPITARKKTVHSTWFEVLTEIGYPGLITFCAMVFCSFRATRTVKRSMLHFKRRGKEHYYKIVAIEGVLISFLVAATFLNRLRAEVLAWSILFTACAYNLYIIQKNKRTNI